MTRKIICLKCFVERDLARVNDPPSVFHKGVGGMAIQEYVCDDCGKRIGFLEECVAFSVWRTDIPYTAWESKYILPMGSLDLESLRVMEQRLSDLCNKPDDEGLLPKPESALRTGLRNLRTMIEKAEKRKGGQVG